jgi:hypothetical protein
MQTATQWSSTLLNLTYYESPGHEATTGKASGMGQPTARIG